MRKSSPARSSCREPFWKRNCTARKSSGAGVPGALMSWGTNAVPISVTRLPPVVAPCPGSATAISGR